MRSKTAKKELHMVKALRLSAALSKEFGRGYSVDNLENMRRFYLAYLKIRDIVTDFWPSNFRNSVSEIKNQYGGICISSNISHMVTLFNPYSA